MKKRAAVLCLLVSLFILSPAKLCLSEDKKEEKSQKQKRTSLVALPIIFYMPETRWGIGAGGLFTYRPKGSQEKSRPSSFSFTAYYTQNKQYGFEISPELYLIEETYLINAYFKISKFPTKFFGIGNDTPDSMEEDYSPRTSNLNLTFQRKIVKKANVYAGVQYKFEHFNILKVETDRMLSTKEIPGSEGGTLSALGFILNWDSRDNIFFPHSGNYFQLTVDFYSPTLGSDFSFTSFKLNLRKYLPVLDSHVLALQTVIQSVTGTPPFHKLSQLGGENIMRGYYSGRYRDKILVAVQAEYRLPIWKRLGMVAFAGLGDVADTLGNIRLGSFKYSVGLGIRFTVVPKEGTNLRLDYGFGKKTSGTYFTVLEAF